jgi:aspartate/methionine/tyrosine aminotransferase
LRQAVAEKTSRSSGTAWDKDNVVITNGAKQSMANVFTILCNPGDEIIVPSPFWLSYKELITLAHAKTVMVPSTLESDYKVTVEDLERARTPRTKAVLFVSPQNPSGTVYTPEEARAIALWAVKHQIWLISDEIYEYFVYDGVKYQSILKSAPELKDQIIILNGVSKTFAMTGWRVGWMVAPLRVAKLAQNIQSQTVSNVFNVAQLAALTAVQSEREPRGIDFITHCVGTFQKRRDLAYQILRTSKSVRSNLPQGAFYFFADISDAMLPGETTMDFLAALLDEERVVMVPGEGFGMSKHVRICYAVNSLDVEEGITRFVRFADRRVGA